MFPASNPWNQDISQAALDPMSDTYIKNMSPSTYCHPDFGTVWQGAPIGIPYIVVPGTQPLVPVSFTYASESDPGPYPIPANAPIEGGSSSTGDRHVEVIDRDHWKVYELFNAFPDGKGGWKADSGAVFDLTTGALRPAGWTSADAAGLPIFPGLARYDEVMVQKEIKHALRFTASRTQMGYISPARHYASNSNDPSLPPMGLRVRLKASYDISWASPPAQVVLKALKKYGMFLADNGNDWMISGAPDSRWSDSQLGDIKKVPGSAFEAVQSGAISH